MAKILVEREERLKKGKIAHEILRVLDKRPLSLPSLKGDALGAVLLPKLESRGIGRKRKNSIRVAVTRLRRQRFIEYTMGNERGTMRLTPTGEKRIRQYDFEELALSLITQWDGIWKIVMFDIPEERKTARDAITRKLKSLGFYQLQRSVFTHFLACREEIEFIKDFFRLDKEITYLETRGIGSHEESLRRHFHLK